MPYRISNTQIAEDATYRLAAYVKATFSNGVTVAGSGLLVGRNDLLTATHVIYNPSRGGLATSINVYLGAELDPDTGDLRDSVATFQIRRPDVLHFGASVFVTGSNDTVTDAEAANDMALVSLPQDIGFDLGWISLSASEPPSAFLGQSFGYPSDFNGLTEGSVSVRSSSSRGILYSMSTDAVEMGAGSSGGPLLYRDEQGNTTVVGVKSAVGESEGVWSNLRPHRAALLAEMGDNNSNLGAGAQDVLGSQNNDELSAASGAVYWSAGAGSDRFIVSGGAHFFAGGEGLDHLDFRLPSNLVRFDQTTAGLTKLVGIADPSNSVILDQVERVHFLAKSVAFDLQGNAGAAAKLVGAVLGAQWVEDEAVMGIAIDLVDGGISSQELVDLGLMTPMAQGVLGRAIGSDRDAIRVVFKNIVGDWPSDAKVESFYAQLGQGPGKTSLEDLIIAGADHPLNLENIDFVGISDQGLWYI